LSTEPIRANHDRIWAKSRASDPHPSGLRGARTATRCEAFRGSACSVRAQRACRRLGPVGDAESLENRRDVDLHSAFGEP